MSSRRKISKPRSLVPYYVIFGLTFVIIMYVNESLSPIPPTTPKTEQGGQGEPVPVPNRLSPLSFDAVQKTPSEERDTEPARNQESAQETPLLPARVNPTTPGPKPPSPSQPEQAAEPVKDPPPSPPSNAPSLPQSEIDFALSFLPTPEHDSERSLLDTIHSYPPSSGHIVFSVFGDNPKYTSGINHNIRLQLIYYPGWKVRVYAASDVPENTVKEVGKERERVRESHACDTHITNTSPS